MRRNTFKARVKKSFLSATMLLLSVNSIQV
jgi:hypothetical protein